jgi:hypothetical protein
VTGVTLVATYRDGCDACDAYLGAVLKGYVS